MRINKRTTKTILILSIAATLFIYACSLVYAEVSGPSTATQGPGERKLADNPLTVAAYAGNVTKLTLAATSVTQSWQGFFGNITGTITLDDANNNTFYDWALAEPQGEIYAANASVSNWDTAHCFNYTNNGSAYNYSYDGGARSTETRVVLNITEIERLFNITYNDIDGIDETFLDTGLLPGAIPHSEFFVGFDKISAGSCPATTTYVSDAQNTLGKFQNILLAVNNTDTIIFATIIETDEPGNRTKERGFNGAFHDFQILVLDNGHFGDEATTTWFMYVELT